MKRYIAGLIAGRGNRANVPPDDGRDRLTTQPHALVSTISAYLNRADQSNLRRTNKALLGDIPSPVDAGTIATDVANFIDDAMELVGNPNATWDALVEMQARGQRMTRALEGQLPAQLTHELALNHYRSIYQHLVAICGRINQRLDS